MSDEELVQQGVSAASKIAAASRKFRGSGAFPYIAEGAYVAFYEGDRRFELAPEVIFYVWQYLGEHRKLTLEAALRDENHVRELIDVITS